MAMRSCQSSCWPRGAKDRIIADDARKVRFHLEDEHMDPNSGKPVANVVVYEY